METTSNKIVLVDWNVIVFKSIFASRTNKAVPPTYTALATLISSLRTIGCHPDDMIILAIDSPKGSWRKQVDKDYKANRPLLRKQITDIDWSKMFKMFNDFKAILTQATPFLIAEKDFYEADDIIAVAVKIFKQSPCVIVSSDSDYHQLAEYPHVKIFSPQSKRYQIIKNPANTLLKKIKKEKTDNLTSPIVTEEDYIKRLTIVNLMSLPPDVERDITPLLFDLTYHPYDLTLIPFPSLRERFMEIYNQKKPAPLIPRKNKKKRKTKALNL